MFTLMDVYKIPCINMVTSENSQSASINKQKGNRLVVAPVLLHKDCIEDVQ